MRPVYYSQDEFRCDATLSPPGTVHLHCSSDEEVIEAFLYAQEIGRRSHPKETPTTLLGPPFSVRYWCITGPGGLVLRGFEEDEE